MDFFQAQDTARRKSSLLVFLFIAAVVMITLVIYTTVVGMTFWHHRNYGGPFHGWWQLELFVGVAMGTMALVGLGSIFKTLSLRSGGGVVARSVGGVLINRQTSDQAERRLLNIVEEMAIASGVRIPEVYLIPEDGINAFAAGFSPDDAAVAVTRGALEILNRDELQGVIAHEFSHILNGDMRLNIRLIGLLFGILLIALVGRTLMSSMRYARFSGSRGKNSGGIGIAIIVAAIALLIIGYVGVFFGRLIQAAVSRQREFLADASAVQFTRNPGGIAGALKKIGGHATGSRIANTHAAETGHLVFANALEGTAFNLFATHPPLTQRIRAIDPSFDGRYPKIVPPAPDAPARSAARQRNTPPPLSPEQFIAVIVAAEAADPQSGAAAIEALPESLSNSARDPKCARGIILGLAYDRKNAVVAETQKQIIATTLDRSELDACAPLFPAIGELSHSAVFTLIDLCLPTIRARGDGDTAGFVQAIDDMIAADNQTTLFEFALRHVISRYLNATHENARGPASQIHSYKPLVDEISLVLSALASAGATSPAESQRAFKAGAEKLGLIRDQLALTVTHTLALAPLKDALNRLDCAVPPIKKAVMIALATAAAVDGRIQPAELELLRAIAAALNCPAPVFS